MSKKLITKLLTNYNIFYLLLLVIFCYSFLSLILAYLSQYIFGFEPCILCIYQRILFFIILILASVGIYFYNNKKYSKIIFFGCCFVMMINLLVAFYHSGIELKVFSEYSKCSTKDYSKVKDVETLREMLMQTDSKKCGEVELKIFKLSMAQWNFIVSLLILILFRLVFILQDNRKIVSL